MAEKLLEFSVLTFTADKVEIKVKNISGKVLNETFVLELRLPKYLVSKEINAAVAKAATNRKPIGVYRLDGVVTGPAGWSVWAQGESSVSSVTVQFFNDMDQAGNDINPVPLATGAEFVMRIPLNPEANRANVNLLYSYQHGTNEDPQDRINGQLELKSEPSDWTPDVTLRTNHASPTAIPATESARIIWHIKDGVSATLRGPLPEGNSELALSTDPLATFKIADGFIEVVVVTAMTFILQAEVKRPGGGPNVQVVRMLSLDIKNNKHLYVKPRPSRVLPYGLIEIDWAAWGPNEVTVSVSRHTTRTIQLTKQTLGRFFEGSGVMRVSATRYVDEARGIRTTSEAITIDATGEDSKTKNVQVISWEKKKKSDVDGHLWGMAIIAPQIALLTFQGLYIATGGSFDPVPDKLVFSPKTPMNIPVQWAALTAVEDRFVCLRRIDPSPDFEVAAFTRDGNPDKIAPMTLPREIVNAALSPRGVFDLVGFGGRAYVVVEAPEVPRMIGTVRRAYSVGFDDNTQKADLRPEPLLDPLIGFRLVTFDNALYALNRTSGEMFRFDLKKATGTLDQPKKAASAVKKIEGAKEQSMIADGLIVPMGRMLLVLNPTAVPSVDSLQQHGLQNTLNYESESLNSTAIPQDLFYNPLHDYWARCGHDLEVKPDSVAAFRSGASKRLWVIEPDGETHTLAVGSESLFAPDYDPKFPTRPLLPYLNKTRKFTIKNNTRHVFAAMSETCRKANLLDFSSIGPAELASSVPGLSEYLIELKYNDANPAPITVRLLMQISRTGGLRTDCDYILELIFSGPDLSSVTSVFRRIAVDSRNRLLNDEVFESRVEHPANSSVIEVSKPKQLEKGIPFVIANGTRFALKQDGLQYAPLSFSVGDGRRVAIDPMFQDCTLMLDPGKEPNGGEVRVNFNFALPPGVEVSSGSKLQTKRIRLDPDKAKLLAVGFVGLLNPGDSPLRLPGISQPIEPMTDRVVYVCQLINKP